MKKQHGFARKMREGGNVERPFDHVNHPMDAAHIGGHALNESYKIPPAHPEGKPNLSYMHPLVDPTRENAPTAPKMVFPKVMGKNPGTTKPKRVTGVVRGTIT